MPILNSLRPESTSTATAISKVNAGAADSHANCKSSPRLSTSARCNPCKTQPTLPASSAVNAQGDCSQLGSSERFASEDSAPTSNARASRAAAYRTAPAQQHGRALHAAG